MAKDIFQNSKTFYSFIKNGVIYMYLPFIYKKSIILSLLKIVKLQMLN